MALAVSVLFVSEGIPAQSTPERDRVRPASASARITSLSGFVANDGQWPEEVLFVAREAGVEATLLRDGIVFTPVGRRNEATLDGEAGPEGTDPEPLTLRFAGGAAAALEGSRPLPTRHHFFLGDESRHRTHVLGYESVTYRSVAQGIDLLVRSESTGFAYDLHVAPGADLGALQLEFTGASAARTRSDGVLVMETGHGPLEQHIGAAWEVDGLTGERVEVESAFRLLHALGDGVVQLGFSAPARNASRAFVLDPSLIFSTFIGGESQDALREIDVAPDGSTYLICKTRTGMPVSLDAPDQITETTEAWVGKLSPDGTTLEWGTFLGGDDAEEVVGVHVDQDGSVVATGRTWSGDFPSTVGSLQPASNSTGLAELFVTRLAPNGDAILWSTFYGGADQDDLRCSTLLPSGDVVLGGFANADFPSATSGAYDTQFDSGDSYLVRLAANGARLMSQTYLRVGLDSITSDAMSNWYIGGGVLSEWEPISTPGAFQEAPTPGSTVNGIVLKMDSLGSAVLWATYIGGSATDNVELLAIDSASAVYVSGLRSSPDFPTTQGAYDEVHDSGSSYYVAKFLPEGRVLAWSTLLESPGAAQVMRDLEVDSAGNVIVSGSTNGPNYPTTPDAFQPEFLDPGSSGDATLTKLDPFGETLAYSTYFGDDGQESFARLEFAADSTLRMGLMSLSAQLHVTAGSYDTSYEGSGDLAVVAWDLGLAPWTVLGFGLEGTADTPNLSGAGELTPGAPTRLAVRGALGGASAWFAIGIEAIHLPFKGGVFVPAPTLLVPFTPDISGAHDRAFPWIDVPAGIDFYIQAWIQDPEAIRGWSASNALQFISH